MMVTEVRTMQDAERLIESRRGEGLRAVELHMLQRMFPSDAESAELAALMERHAVDVLPGDEDVR